MYILAQEPESGELSRAFSALDEVFGTDEFDEKSARKVLNEYGFTKSTFDTLVSSNYVSEV